MIKILLVIAMLTLSGCAGVGVPPTDNLTVSTDPYSGELSVNQPVEWAISMIDDSYHALGFTWIKGTPDIVYLHAGLSEMANIDGVSFKVDGVIIKGKLASKRTKYGRPYQGIATTRRFYISMSDFVVLSKGKDIYMKLEFYDSYSVSTFGAAHPIAAVSSKFLPFINEVSRQKALTSAIAYNR